ncbi:MFS transporter [Bifidobacterium leontopitheci]|uniref:MFS transporter n=1 Tax=Bifidobacterium leontopitheci TaxID=2650774 RepID=UPI003672DB0B
MAALIFLVALNLRPAIVAVGPVLTRIGDELHWGETVLGLLGAMPLWMFAAFSPLVRFITARIGEDRTILAALLVLAAGDIVRSFGGPAGIWLGTVAVGAGIAAGNVLVPAIAKRDYAGHVPLATGVYSACITSGSAIAGLTSATFADMFGDWRRSLAVWALPALVVAGAWSIRLTRRGPRDGTSAQSVESGSATGSTTGAASDVTTSGATPGARPTARPATRPLWRRPMTWWVTLFMGLQSAAFYTMSNWLPSVAVSAGFTDMQAGVQLFVFQSLGILSGLLIPALMRVRGNQVCAALTASVPMVIAGFGWMLLPSWSAVWSVVGGVGQGASLVVALTLISLRGRTAEETVALSGMAQSIGYLIASVGPFAFGALSEASGTWSAPFVLVVVLALAQCAVAFPAGVPSEEESAM